MIEIVVIRGAGDLASGVIQKFNRAGFNVVALESENPSFIRRKVSFGMAIYEREFSLEGATSKFVGNIDELISNRELLERLENCFCEEKIPIIIDPAMKILEKIANSFPNEIRVIGVVDAIIGKKNYGMRKELAPITIALGPGFYAGEDVDIVIETMRGHDMGKLIFHGQAQKNTGIPGMVGGESLLRVIYSEVEGVLKIVRDIGDVVKRDEVIAYIDETPVRATISGLLRGMIIDGFYVKKGVKIADIDPRIDEYSNCFSISDKARALGGGALEAFLYMNSRKNSEKIIEVGNEDGKSGI